MDWLELTVDTSPKGIDAVVDTLTDLGIAGVMIDDEADFHDFLENNHQYWDYVDDDLMAQKKGLSRVTFYLENAPESAQTLTAVRTVLDTLRAAHPEYAPLALGHKNVADADWENNWKAFYKPMEIGERLLVLPEWETTDAHGRTVLRLNPGLTFGTGSHATTRLCLTALDTHVKGGEKVLDLGCGSGILSIAALLLGARAAFACDIDEKCVDVAYENAALNGIGKETYTVRWGDVTRDTALQNEFGGDYDLICANIVADVIISLSSQVRRFLKPGGMFLTSGIIDDRAEEVAAALRANRWDIVETHTSEGWYSFLCR